MDEKQPVSDSQLHSVALTGDNQLPVPAELLKRLQKQQEAAFFKEDTQEALRLYIPSQVNQLVGDDKPKGAEDRIRDWLSHPNKQCLLLLGDSGSGKTLFTKWLVQQIWQNPERQYRIPLFIPLLYQENPKKNLIDDYLRDTCGIEDEAQRELIKQLPLLLVWDGFDEIHQKINLHKENKLWQLKDVKIIISCRSQALAQTYNYASLFCPYDNKNKPQTSQLQEYVISRFTEDQIDAYLERYTSLYQNEIKETHPDWVHWETYQNYIKKFPWLQSLFASPFVLSIAMRELPSIAEKLQGKKDIERHYLTRIHLYDQFVEKWFNRQRGKLLEAEQISENYPIKELFAKCSKAIANAMLQTKVDSIQLTPNEIVPLLSKQGFFGDIKSNLQAKHADARKQLQYFDQGVEVNGEIIKLSVILSGCPMMEVRKRQFAFLHGSLMEYFAARRLFEGMMVDASIALGYELNEMLLVDEPDTLQFLAEQVKRDDELKQRLFGVIEESMHEERIETASANAMTILIKAGVAFSEYPKSLRRIRIKGADVSRGILDSVDLREADLREVNFHGAWLNNANFGGALVEGIQFGEYPYLKGGNQIKRVAYSPNGQYLAAGDDKGKIYLWETATGKLMTVLKSDGSCIIGLDFCHNGFALIYSTLSSVNMLTINKKIPLCRISTEKINVRTSALHLNGRMLAVGGGLDNGELFLWDILTQKKIGEPKGHTERVNTVSFSPTELILASGSGNDVFLAHFLEWYPGNDSNIRHNCRDFSIRLWDVQEQRQIGETMKHPSAVNCIAFSPDGMTIVSGGEDEILRLWARENQQLVGTMSGHTSPIFSVAFCCDGKLIASGDLGGTVCLWDFKSQKLLSQMRGGSDPIWSLSFSSDGKLASTSKEGIVHIWDVRQRSSIHEINKGKDDFIDILSIAFNPHNKLLAVANGSRQVCLWDIQEQKLLRKREGHVAFKVAFNSSGKILATASNDSSIIFWGVENQEFFALAQLNELRQSVEFIGKNNKRTTKTPAKQNEKIDMFDKIERHVKDMLGDDDSAVLSIAFSPDDKMLAAGSADNLVYVADIENGELIACISGHEDSVGCIAFSQDNKILISGSRDNTVCVWDIQNKKLISRLTRHKDWVNSVVCSPDGNIFASGGGDKTVCLWNIKTLKLLRELKGHDEEIISLAFSQNSEILASGGNDCSLRLWEVSTGLCLNIMNFDKRVSGLAFEQRKTENYLYVSTSTNIYYFKIVKTQTNSISCILLRTIGPNSGLRANNLNLGGVVGLQQHHNRLLEQYKAVGNPSAKETQKVLEDRNQLVPYTSTQPIYNLFNQQYSITPQDAVVSMVRKSNQEGDNHVFLVIEHIRDNHYVIIRADLFLDKRQMCDLFLMSSPNDNSYSNCRRSCENQLYLYKDNDGTIFYYIEGDEQKQYLKDGENQPLQFPLDAAFNSSKCDNKEITKAVLDITSKRGHTRQSYSEGWIFASGQALIEICEKPLADMRELVSQCVYKCWKITSDKVDELRQNLESDQKKRVQYFNFGNSPLYSYKPNEETHNCLTWCEGHLKMINVNVASQQKWLAVLDIIVAYPKFHLPDAELPKNDSPPKLEKPIENDESSRLLKTNLIDEVSDCGLSCSCSIF